MLGRRYISVAQAFRDFVFLLYQITLIDVRTAIDISTAFLTAAGVRLKSKTKSNTDIVDFARTANAAATCAPEDTAGGHSIDVCVMAGCEQNTKFLAWFQTLRKGVCYVLCTLASAPCTKE